MQLFNMPQKIRFLVFVLLGLAAAGNAWSQTAALPASSEFSFTPPKPCIPARKAPPNALLKKNYKVINPSTDIHQLDVNGDGICDWLREGFAMDRRDQKEARWEDFLFLGTAQGWRRIKPLTRKDYQSMPGIEHWRGSPPSPIGLVAYQKGYPLPYVVSVRPVEGAPYIDLVDVRIGTWDPTFESFKDVDTTTREKILSHLAQTFCREGVDPEQVAKDFEWSYFEPLIIPTHGGSLCRLK